MRRGTEWSHGAGGGGRGGALLRHHLQVSAFPGVVGAKGEMDVAISSSVLPSHSLSSSRPPPPPPRRCDVTLAHRRRTQYPNQFECHNTASQPASQLLAVVAPRHLGRGDSQSVKPAERPNLHHDKNKLQNLFEENDTGFFIFNTLIDFENQCCLVWILDSPDPLP